MEKLRILKRLKRWVECHWRKTKNESDKTQVKSPVKACLVAVRVAKHKYFSRLIAFEECHPMALLRFSCSLHGRQSSSGDVDEFVQHMQVTVMARRAIAQVYVVHQLHPFLDRGDLHSITHALSHLDYCNVLFKGSPMCSS